METAAVTDHGTMSGILDYYKTAKKAGIKPIIGIETSWRLVRDLTVIRARISSVFT